MDSTEGASWDQQQVASGHLVLRSPLIGTPTWRWIDTVTRLLEISEVAPDDVVVLLTNGAVDRSLHEACFHALERLGCAAVSMTLAPPMGLDDDPVDNPVVLAGLAEADLIVDLADAVAHSALRAAITADTRTLAIGIGEATELNRLIAHPGLQQRTAAMAVALTKGARLRIESPSAARLDVSLDEQQVTTKTGALVGDASFARWPGGSVTSHLGDAAAAGTVVLMPGDVIAEANHIVRTPVRLEIERGHVVEILGDSSDADIIRSLIETHADTDAAFKLGSVTIGLNLTRGEDALALFDPRRMAVGRAQLGAGMCTLTLGAAEAAAATLCLSSTSVTVDDAPLIDQGTLAGTHVPDIYELSDAM